MQCREWHLRGLGCIHQLWLPFAAAVPALLAACPSPALLAAAYSPTARPAARAAESATAIAHGTNAQVTVSPSTLSDALATALSVSVTATV